MEVANMLLLSSPGTVKILAYSLIEFDEEGEKYAIVMEHMDGSLKGLIKLKGRFQ